MLDKVELGGCLFHISLKDIAAESAGGGFDEEFSILLMSYNAMGEIDLEDEIGGGSDFLAGLALLSAEKSATVFCGVTTNIMGIKHISIVVCHKGKLVDIVDRTSNPFGDEFETSEKIKIYSTDCGRIALLVDKDILIEKNWEKVTPFCDYVVSIVKGADERIPVSAIDLCEKFDKPLLIINDNSIQWK